MSIIVETALPVLLERLVNILVSVRPKLLKYETKIAEEVNKWCPVLEDLRFVLQDAEDKKLSNSEIEPWLLDLEDIVLDVEDVLEEIENDIRQTQRQSQGNKQRRRRARFISFCSKILQSQSSASVELRKLTARLNDILERKQRLELLKGNASIPRQRAIRDPSAPVSAELKLYGREAEKKTIIEFLRHGIDGIDVLPIVGAGGIGKTTLVQHIYSDDEVVCLFQLRAWVCISQEWNLHNIFKSILEGITARPCDLQDIDLRVLHELQDKKFLIVLDDIWSDDILQWNQLRAPLMVGGPGSKIIVTTRKINVANLVKTVNILDLGYLSQKDWLDIFCSYVGFDIRTSSATKIREVGEDMSQKYGGLPLAATIIGSLLRGSHNEDDWSAILNNNSTMSQGRQSQIDIVLKMSYNDLPYELKSCFLYCTIFPEDHKFREADLVQLWIAAGLIKCDSSSVGGKDIETVGYSYFMDLVSRSLLTSFNEYYVMHDLVREMGRRASYNRYCRWENAVGSWKRIRHLSVNKSIMGQVILDLEQIEEKTFPLRTLIILGGDYDFEQINDIFFSKFPKLRVLQAIDLPILKLSKFIYQMNHLKYLNLQTWQGFSGLSRELGNLVGLTQMVLQDCKRLMRLPAELGNLHSLQYLDLDGCSSLMELPKELGNLNNLQHLNLCGCMRLTELSVELGNLGNLQKLDLRWCIGLIGLPIELESLGKLQHLNLRGCTGLTELPIELGNLGSLQYLDLSKCTGLMTLPCELGNLSNLHQLFLGGCIRLTKLPVELGKLNTLQYLKLWGCRGLTELPTELGNLACLLHFDLRECTRLTELPSEFGNLSNLQYLDLGGCKGLISLPTELGNLRSLQYLSIVGCKGLTKLPVKLGNLYSLKQLCLWWCTGLMRLPVELGKLSSLQYLDLWRCMGLMELPIEIGNLVNLQHLDLRGCTGLTRLPGALENLGSLQHLDLRECTGLTAAELGNLKSLHGLYLLHNF